MGRNGLRNLIIAVFLLVWVAGCAASQPAAVAPTPTPAGEVVALATEQPAQVEATQESVPEAGQAKTGEVVAVSWGGSYQAAQREAYWQPFQEETGIKVIEAESPEHARIKAQVDSGQPEWDLVTTGLSAMLELGPDYFEPIEYDKYPEAYADIPDTMKREHGIVGATYCYALVYRTDVFPEGQAPQTWADFWDTEKFPGPRGMALDAGVPWNSVEAAWIAAGNDASTLAEVDLDVIFQQFDKLRPAIGKWWGSGAEALQLLANQEVVMAIAPTGDILELINQGIPVAISWDNAFCGNDYWYILKGSRNEEAAQQLLASMQNPERQAEFVKKVPFGVPNPKAYDYLSPEVAAMLPTAPDHADQIVLLEEERSKWWAENREAVVERFNQWRLDSGEAPADTEQPATEEPATGEAAAPSGEVVVVSWGGSYQAAQREAYWQPFASETGINVIEAESPEHARIKAQVDSGQPEWDLVTTGLSALLELGPEYFEPIDYDQYAAAYADIPENMKLERAIVGATFCYAVTYRTDVFPEGQGPQNWADFWDTEKFPGPRGMALDAGVPWNSVEAAWLAAGNSGDTLDAMDLDVVFEQFDQLKPNIGKWWGSGAEALQLLANNEVVMAIAPTGDLLELINQGVPIAFSWDQALCGNDMWYILKGSRNLDAAQQLLASMQDPQRQAEFVKQVPFGVPNPKAYDYLDAEIAKLLPTAPDHADKILIRDGQWWAENREEVVQRFNEWRLQ